LASVAIEVGQARFSSLRTFELDDIALNAVGIGAGLAVVVVVGRLLDRAERHRWGT
jgi:glycopeptide antibiotics resistance protein